MSWRIILITKPCRLLTKNKQLIYQPKDEAELKVPLEDICAIVLDTKEVSISGYLLSEIAENKIAVFTVDFSHIPNGIFLPYMKYYRNSETAFLQNAWTEPFKKRVWQKIIQQKVVNQAYNIKNVNNDKYKYLIHLSKNISSGDLENIEGLSAREYWKCYYPNFVRHSATKINSALDYAYSIVRGIIAKNLVSYGFIPCFGLHHCNTFNSFNLADDMIEPFRGFVENRVKNLYFEDSNDTNLSPKEKQELIKIMFYEVKYDNKYYSIQYTIQLLVENLLVITKSNNAKNINLPTF